MLVDLGRNDLGRVCMPGTVRVEDYSHIERYSHVMHLVSTVTGHAGRGQDRTRRRHRVLPRRDAVRRPEGAGDAAHRGGREDAPRPLRRRARLPRLRGQRRLRDRHPHRADARRHGLRAGRRGSRRRLQRALRVHRGGEQGQGSAQRDRRGGDAEHPGTHRIFPARPADHPHRADLLVLGAGGLWAASRLAWVDVALFDGLGPAQVDDAQRCGRGRRRWCRWHCCCSPPPWRRWRCGVGCCDCLRCSSPRACDGLPGVNVGDFGRGRAAAHLAHVPRPNWSTPGAITAARDHPGRRGLRTARCRTVDAVGVTVGGTATRDGTPGARRATLRLKGNDETSMSERTIWDALDEGHDPTAEPAKRVGVGAGRRSTPNRTTRAGDRPSAASLPFLGDRLHIRERPGKEATA